MKRLTYGTLLFLNLILSGSLYSQNHCIPLDESRWLHEQAVKAHLLDSIVHYQGKQIDLLTDLNFKTYHDNARILAVERAKFNTQKEITQDFVRLADSWKQEANYYQKKYRKQRTQKGLLTAGMVGLLILMIVK